MMSVIGIEVIASKGRGLGMKGILDIGQVQRGVHKQFEVARKLNDECARLLRVARMPGLPEEARIEIARSVQVIQAQLGDLVDTGSATNAAVARVTTSGAL